MPPKFRLVTCITFFLIMTSFPYFSFIRPTTILLLFHVSLLQYFPTMGQQPPVGQDLLIIESLRSDLDNH